MAVYTVNKEAVRHAKRLIDARQFVLRSRWQDVRPRAREQNAFLKTHSWEEYAVWHLGLTEDAAEETKALYAFVYGDLRRLPSDGLIACTFVPRSGGTRKSSSQRTSSCSISTERPPDKAAALRAALSLRTATCDRASPRITRPLSARAGSLFVPWRRLQLGDRAVDSQSPRVLVHAAGCGQLGSLPRRRRRLSYCSGW